jgi:hypothetical protein
MGLWSSSAINTQYLPVHIFIGRQRVLTPCSSLIISNCQCPKLSTLSESVLHLFLFSYLLNLFLWPVPMHDGRCSSIVGVRGTRLVSHFPHSIVYTKSLTVLVWWNNCTTESPTTSRDMYNTCYFLETSKKKLKALYCHTNRLSNKLVMSRHLVWVAEELQRLFKN